MPPSFVLRPLMPWPPLRTASGQSGCRRANATASATCCGRVGLQHDARRAAAHVGGAHVGVVEVARLDRVRVPRGRRRTRCRRGARRARPPSGRTPRRCRARARSRATSSRTAGATSSPNACSSARVVAREDEGADAVLEREPRRAARRTRRGSAASWPTLSRRRISRGSRPTRLGGLVDRGVAAAEVAGLHVAERGQPAVALAAGEGEHARLVRADPDRDVVRRARSALRAVHAVVPAVGEGAAALARVPQLADDVDRLFERGDRLPGREAAAAHGLDRVPEAAGAEARGRSDRPRAGRGSRRRARRRRAAAAARSARWGRCGCCRSAPRRRSSASTCRGTRAGTGGPGR